MSDDRECTCYPDEAPVPCQKQYAFTECEILRLRAENEKLRAELKANISFIRKQADEIAELRKAVALKETGD